MSCARRGSIPVNALANKTIIVTELIKHTYCYSVRVCIYFQCIISTIVTNLGRNIGMSGVGESRASKRRRKEKDRASFGRNTADHEDTNFRADQSVTGYNNNSLSLESAGACASVASLKVLLNTTDDYNKVASDLMQHLVFPTDLSAFYNNWWRKVPLVSARGNELHFKGLPVKNSAEKCTKEHAIVNGRDVIIRRGGDALGGDGENVVSAKDIWNQFDNGFVVEFLHPQKYFDKLWHYISLLEIEFKSTIVPSLIVAPSGAQCFTDDLIADNADTFVIHLAGSATWTLIPPETRGRASESEGAGKKITERTSSGDSLYIPPEWTFSSSVPVGEEAVFCVMRMNHNRSILDLTQMVASQSVLKMVSDKKSSNHTLPRDFFDFMGVAHSEEDEDPRRVLLMATAKKIMSHLIHDAVEMMDAAADQLAKDFICSRAPIPLTDEEDRLSYSGTGRDIKLFPYSKLRMIRPGSAIAVVEGGNVVVYHCMENSRYATLF